MNCGVGNKKWGRNLGFSARPGKKYIAAVCAGAWLSFHWLPRTEVWLLKAGKEYKQMLRDTNHYFSKICIFLIICMHLCLRVRTSAVPKEARKGWWELELELQEAGSSLTWVLEAELRSLGRAASTPTIDHLSNPIIMFWGENVEK